MTGRAATHQAGRRAAAEILLGAGREVADRGQRDDAAHRGCLAVPCRARREPVPGPPPTRQGARRLSARRAALLPDPPATWRSLRGEARQAIDRCGDIIEGPRPAAAALTRAPVLRGRPRIPPERAPPLVVRHGHGRRPPPETTVQEDHDRPFGPPFRRRTRRTFCPLRPNRKPQVSELIMTRPVAQYLIGRASRPGQDVRRSHGVILPALRASERRPRRRAARRAGSDRGVERQ